ncbi:hypothetical protein [Candidatus Cardinium hertigii]|uniref:Uncharacterized protein n=1 Tax=Candidatus Cardinium hertigii TaxID=247481 RepID=A0A2Z3LHE0_9BACT|nr:hypothetical protein [Candidatus Cardinium hertigii]AWN81460.1 hypothetical protein DK880_00123 [Candidatus Cardinium hertigii]
MTKRGLLLWGALLGGVLVWHLIPDAQNKKWKESFYSWLQRISIKTVIRPLLKLLLETLSTLYFKAVLLGCM